LQTIDERLHALEQAVNTYPTAILNALLAVLTAVNAQNGVDKAALRAELEEVKGIHIPNGNQQQYAQMLDMVIARLN
jgi:hypothetical protein